MRLLSICNVIIFYELLFHFLFLSSQKINLINFLGGNYNFWEIKIFKNIILINNTSTLLEFLNNFFPLVFFEGEGATQIFLMPKI